MKGMCKMNEVKDNVDKVNDLGNKIYKSKLGFWPNNALSCLIE